MTGSGFVQPPIPRFSGILGGGGGGGGGAGELVTLIASVNVSLGAIVSINASGEAQLANSSLAFTPRRYNAIGVAKAAGLAGAAVKFYTDMITVAPMLFAVAPLAADNGKRVYLSTTPGVATLTAPGSGNAVYLVGILKGANGVTTVPAVMLQFQLGAELP